MSLEAFANATESKCTAPLLDQELFGKTGGYIEGRYCGLGSFEDGTTCCFPCPIQDWIYPPEWESQLRIPNYLSILSVNVCCFLLLSFAVLPTAKSHSHYLSVGLLVPVLLISLSFAIPVTTSPSLCHDAITPADMHTSLSCAWTGSLVTLGGLGCVIWVFLRSLWLHIRVVWDIDLGRRFKWASIAAGTILPIVYLVAILATTGFSYRMGQTCLPNRDHAIVTFWVWLVVFAILAFLLQGFTTAYCVFVYLRSLRRERRRTWVAEPVPESSSDYEDDHGGNGNNTRCYSSRFQHQHPQVRKNCESWRNVKKMFVLQWRNIAVSIFVLIGSLIFFIVFWTQDSKLGRVFNDPENIRPVKRWIICHTLTQGDKEGCRKYVDGFTVQRPAVLTALVLASLVGIEIFVLLFRRSMFEGWVTLFRNIFPCSGRRSRSDELTSFENTKMYMSASSSGKHLRMSDSSPNTEDRGWTNGHKNSVKSMRGAAGLRSDAHNAHSTLRVQSQEVGYTPITPRSKTATSLSKRPASSASPGLNFHPPSSTSSVYPTSPSLPLPNTSPLNIPNSADHSSTSEVSPLSPNIVNPSFPSDFSHLHTVSPISPDESPFDAQVPPGSAISPPDNQQHQTIHLQPPSHHQHQNPYLHPQPPIHYGHSDFNNNNNITDNTPSSRSSQWLVPTQLAPPPPSSPSPPLSHPRPPTSTSTTSTSTYHTPPPSSRPPTTSSSILPTPTHAYNNPRTIPWFSISRNSSHRSNRSARSARTIISPFARRNTNNASPSVSRAGSVAGESVRSRGISQPVEGTFRHVGGAFVDGENGGRDGGG